MHVDEEGFLVQEKGKDDQLSKRNSGLGRRRYADVQLCFFWKGILVRSSPQR